MAAAAAATCLDVSRRVRSNQSIILSQRFDSKIKAEQRQWQWQWQRGKSSHQLNVKCRRHATSRRNNNNKEQTVNAAEVRIEPWRRQHLLLFVVAVSVAPQQNISFLCDCCCCCGVCSVWSSVNSSWHLQHCKPLAPLPSWIVCVLRCFFIFILFLLLFLLLFLAACIDFANRHTHTHRGTHAHLFCCCFAFVFACLFLAFLLVHCQRFCFLFGCLSVCLCACLAMCVCMWVSNFVCVCVCLCVCVCVCLLANYFYWPFLSGFSYVWLCFFAGWERKINKFLFDFHVRVAHTHSCASFACLPWLSPTTPHPPYFSTSLLFCAFAMAANPILCHPLSGFVWVLHETVTETVMETAYWPRILSKNLLIITGFEATARWHTFTE